MYSGCLCIWRDLGRNRVTILRPIPSTLGNTGQMLPKVGYRVGNLITQAFLMKFQILAVLILDLRPLQC